LVVSSGEPTVPQLLYLVFSGGQYERALIWNQGTGSQYLPFTVSHILTQCSASISPSIKWEGKTGALISFLLWKSDPSTLPTVCILHTSLKKKLEISFGKHKVLKKDDRNKSGLLMCGQLLSSCKANLIPNLEKNQCCT
jgi:hypothetical protein